MDQSHKESLKKDLTVKRSYIWFGRESLAAQGVNKFLVLVRKCDASRTVAQIKPLSLGMLSSTLAVA